MSGPVTTGQHKGSMSRARPSLSPASKGRLTPQTLHFGRQKVTKAAVLLQEVARFWQIEVRGRMGVGGAAHCMGGCMAVCTLCWASAD